MVAQLVKQRVEQLEEEYSFYPLPAPLAARMYAWHLRRLPDLGELPSLQNDEQVLKFGRTVSERLYRILASMARAGSESWREVSLRQALTDRLPVMLGLADPGPDARNDPPEATEMCSELVEDFVRWLQEEKGGMCVTGWGWIDLRPNGDLFLSYTGPRYKRSGRKATAQDALSMSASGSGD